MRKNGEVRNGKKLRRGNNTGTLYQKTDKAGKPTGPFYMRFCERTPEGKVIRRAWSTQTDDREAAQEVLKKKALELGFGLSEEAHVDALLTAKRNIDNEHARLKKERAEREAAEREAAEREAAAERERNAISFVEAFVVYRGSTKRPDSGPRTLADYERQYYNFLAWLNAHHPEVSKLHEFTPQMADEFITGLTESGRSRSTRNKYLVFLRSFWRVLRWEKNALLSIDPWEGIRNLSTKVDEVIHKELTIEELANVGQVLLSGNVSGYRMRNVFLFGDKDIREEMRALFAVGIYTGLRLGDCACLDWGEIDLVRGIIDTMPNKTKRKYKRHVIIPIHPVLRSLLEEYEPKKRHGPLLPTLCDIYTNKEPSMLTNRIQAILEAAKIETKTKPENGEKARTLAGFHSLRHTFASIMLNAGADSMLVEKMLGHSSDSMTARYFHEHAKALALAIANLPSLPQLIGGEGKQLLDVDTKESAAIIKLKALAAKMTVAELRNAIRICQTEITNKTTIEIGG